MQTTSSAHQFWRFPLGVALSFWVWAAILRPVKHVVPLPVLVRLVHARRRSACRLAGHEAAILGYIGANGPFPRRPPANCLERSLAAFRLLAAAGAQPELWVGVRRVADPRVVDGHVWLVLDDRPVGEAAEFIEQFTAVLRFDAGGTAERLAHAPAAVTRARTPLSAP